MTESRFDSVSVLLFSRRLSRYCARRALTAEGTEIGKSGSTVSEEAERWRLLPKRRLLNELRPELSFALELLSRLSLLRSRPLPLLPARPRVGELEARRVAGRSASVGSRVAVSPCDLRDDSGRPTEPSDKEGSAPGQAAEGGSIGAAGPAPDSSLAKVGGRYACRVLRLGPHAAYSGVWQFWADCLGSPGSLVRGSLPNWVCCFRYKTSVTSPPARHRDKS